MSFRSSLAVVLLTGATAPGMAAGPLTVTTRVMTEQPVAAADGTTRMRLVNPAKVVPGDRLTVVVTYRNTGTQPIADLVLANPVPAGLAYRAAASGSPTPDLSVDGRHFGSLVQLSVAVSGGRRQAEPSDVTQVRWRLSTPVTAGSSGEFAFQAVVR